ncbi:MAG: rRNA pseudouridine synthase [Gemmatimonadetes bacterium]|nr:rRNA pseudouridine synthase [Gemmatimonadota bacterium]
MRLQKYLARAGVASRRASEELIREGRVKVDGDVVTVLGTKVDPQACVVEVDDRQVQLEPSRWIMLHKPPGCLCTRSDPEGRPTVYDLIGPEFESLFHVGRLDYMSEGMLLLTNEGVVAEHLLHPRNRVLRCYEVTVAGPIPRDVGTRLRNGVELDDGPAWVDDFRVRPGPRPDQVVLELSLREGRNREVRRMMEAVDLTIHALKRVAFGPLELGNLPRGSWRSLEEGEIDRLRALNRNE